MDQTTHFWRSVGGQAGSVPYYQGASYEQFFQPPVIMNGYLYYNTILAQEPSSGTTNPSITVVNMRTGQTAFTIPNASLSFGQIYTYVSPNQAGAFAYLWSVSGSTWTMYDASTGTKILSLADVPSGVTVPSSDGSLLVYSLRSNPDSTYQLSLWNSSKLFQQHPLFSTAIGSGDRTHGRDTRLMLLAQR